jgi:hypothetical protein
MQLKRCPPSSCLLYHAAGPCRETPVHAYIVVAIVDVVVLGSENPAQDFVKD